MEKINCGGFYVGDGLELDGKVLKSTGGITDAPADGKQYARKDHEWSEVQSSGGGAMVVNVTQEGGSWVADKTFEEIVNAAPLVLVQAHIDEGLYTLIPICMETDTMEFGFTNYQIDGSTITGIVTVIVSIATDSVQLSTGSALLQ